MHISKAVINQTIDSITGLLNDNQDDIEDAYCNEEKSISIAISIKYGIAKGGQGIGIETGINFVKERVKQKTVAIVDDKQKPLFGGVEKVEISSGGKTVSLYSKNK